MAVTYDATGAGANGAGVTSITWSHTTGSGANRALLVFIAGNSQVSGVTYNAVAMTLSAEINTAAAGLWTSIWHLANPASGAHNVVATFPTGRAEGQSISVAGANQSTVIGTPQTAEDETTTTTTGNVTVTSATGELIYCLVQRDGADGIIFNAAHTERYNSQVEAASEYMAICEEDGGASVNISWSGNGVGDQWGMVAVPIQVAGASASALAGNMPFATGALTVALPDFARPLTDISAGTWTVAPLHDKIDEITASDADFITSADRPGGGGDVCEVRLSALIDPATSSGHHVRYRYAKSVAAGARIDLQVDLVQGTTIIQTWNHADISDTYVTADQTLGSTETDSISDYSNLRLRFTAVKV